MKYKLVIFDMDGTILNTLEDLANSLNYALEKSGFPKRNLSEVRSFVGNGIQKLVERGVPTGSSEVEIERVLDNFTKHYKVHCSDNTRPYEGITNLLIELKDKNYLIAVVSNKADYAVQALCNKYFPQLFDAVVGEKTSVRKKPAPDTVNYVLNQLKINQTDAIYIGDSEVDIETAKNADMNCISVDWGFRVHEDLIKAGATKIVSRPIDIMSEI